MPNARALRQFWLHGTLPALWLHRALPALASAACATHGGITTAHSIGRGQMQVALEPGLQGAIGSEGVGLAPVGSVAARLGVSDRVDVGARVATFGFEVFGKVVLTGGADGFVVSVAPHLGVIPGGDWALLSGRLPVLFGLPLGDHQLVFGPTVMISEYYGDSVLLSPRYPNGPEYAVPSATLGGVVAFSYRAGDTLRLHPELAFGIPLPRRNTMDVQVGVSFGILIGGR